MNHCPSCGTELPEGAKFCFNCGQQVPADEPSPYAPPADVPPPSSDLPAAAPPPLPDRPVPQRPVPQRPVPQRHAPGGVPDDDLPPIAPPPPTPPPGFEPPLPPPPPGDDLPIPTEPPHAPADDADEPILPPPPRPVYGAYARGETTAPGLAADEPPEFPTEPPHDLPTTPPSSVPAPPPDLPLRLSLSDEPTTFLPDEPRDHEIDPTQTYVAIEERVRPADGPLIAGRNWFASHKLLTALAAAAVIAIVVLAILAADPNETPGPGAIASPGATAAVTTSPSAPSTALASPTAPAGIASPAASGATSTATSPGIFRDGNIEFAVLNTECGNETINDPSGGQPAQADGQFCYVAVRAKNMGTTSRTLRLEDQKIFASDNKEYPADSEAWSRLPANDKQLFSEIRAGSQAEGTIIFDIPKGTTPTRVKLHESQSSGGVTIPIG